MALSGLTIGLVGGTGMLGSAIATGILKAGAIGPERLWVSNRSGAPITDGSLSGVQVTADNQRLVDACNIVVLSVPPAQAKELRIDARDRLVVSVMAGVTLDDLREIAATDRVVRAMSSPAAGLGLAYSPWIAGPGVGTDDRARVRALFAACGKTDEVRDEAHIEVFTALTGPVPGFVAFFADCMAGYAAGKGVDPQIADRAVRQLFLAAGHVMAEGKASPADHVKEMVDYAGTTAAGLNAMIASSIADDIAKGLDAAVERTRTIG